MKFYPVWEKDDRGREYWDFFAPGARTPCRRFEIIPVNDNVLLQVSAIHVTGHRTVISGMSCGDVNEAKRAVEMYNEKYGDASLAVGGHDERQG